MRPFQSMKTSIMSARMVTESGGWFDFCNPDSSNIQLSDVAVGLSRVHRFGGHTTEGWYSVAEHCVHVARILTTKEEKLYALFHDASEAFLGDMIAPLKAVCPDFKNLEDMAQRYIYRRWGLDPDNVPPSVRIADLTMLHTEMKEMCNHNGWNCSQWCEDNKIPFIDGFVFAYWKPDRAQAMWGKELSAIMY